MQDLHRSNSEDKSRIMQSPERVKRKIQDMATNSELLKPQITQVENTRAMYATKEAVLRTLVHVSGIRYVVGDVQAMIYLRFSCRSRICGMR